MERKNKGIIVGAVGLGLNILLGAAKLVAGIFTGSVSIIADAANNISDSGSSVVTVGSFILSGRKADREHPYGHGRLEYVAGLIIGLLVIVVGFEFFLTGIKKIITPEPVELNTMGIVILALSIGIKLFMFFFYRIFSKKISSDTLLAAAGDSFFDVLTTSVVLGSFILNQFLPFEIDGACAMLVSLIIMWGGAKIVFSTTGKLMGNGADPELTRQVYEMLEQSPDIIGSHDLSVHDYGPDKLVGTVHAEFDKDMTISQAHMIIDNLEKRAYKELGIDLVIHVDPIDNTNPEVCKLRENLKEILSAYHSASLHELKIDNTAKTVEFDVKLPQRYSEVSERIENLLREHIAAEREDYDVKIGFDII